MLRKSLIAVGLLISMGVAFFVGMFVEGASSQDARDRLIGVAWGGGRYGPAFYGAYVEIVPVDTGYSVQAYIRIGHGMNYVQDCGELGRVKTREEAVARWSRIEWRADGLHIGQGSDEYFLPQEKVETHR